MTQRTGDDAPSIFPHFNVDVPMPSDTAAPLDPPAPAPPPSSEPQACKNCRWWTSLSKHGIRAVKKGTCGVPLPPGPIAADGFIFVRPPSAESYWCVLWDGEIEA